MQKTLMVGKHRIVVKIERKRIYVQHSDINQNRFMLVDDMFNLNLNEDEKTAINKAIDELC